MDDRRPLVIAFLIAVIILAGGVGWYLFRGREAPPPEVVAPGSAETVARPAPTAEIAAPSFDIVRVDAAGTAVIAGRGEPRATAVVLANGAPLIESNIDSFGEWTAIVRDPLPTGALELALLERLPDGREIRSDQVVVISIPETRDSKPLVVLGRPGGASRILQSPIDDADMTLALLAVDYDDAGGVIFSGRAEPNARVRVLANGALVGETRAADDGNWTLTAGSTLPPGRYDLQIDQLDAEGRVTAVIVAPFERATPEDLAEVGPRTVIVQPGNSLWRIARRLYGSGWQYTVIYQANETQIRDPDLIYPGQIFKVPEGEGG